MTQMPTKDHHGPAVQDAWETPVLKSIDVMEQTMKVGISGPRDGGIKKS
ncbi:MAG: hypothetical protein ACPGOY_12360 [Rhodospirillaceae bacterium]